MYTTSCASWRVLRTLGFILMLMCSLLIGETTVHGAGLTASIDWHMLNKFDWNSYHNGNQPTPDQFNPTSWQVELDGCSSVPHHDVSFIWDIDLPSGVERRESGTCKTPFIFPTQGTFRVKLTITDSNSNTAEATRYITVKNYLIVSLSDSVASGEGNPDFEVDLSQRHGFNVPPRAGWTAAAIAQLGPGPH